MAGHASFAFAANAADMQIKSPMYKAPQTIAVYNWTGFYLGENAGYSWGKSQVGTSSFSPIDSGLNFDGVGAVSSPASAASGNLKPRGWIGGFQAGYNWKANTNWVIGFETDYQWSEQQNSIQQTLGSSFTNGALDPNDGQIVGTSSNAWSIQSRLQSFGTVRGRIGFVPDSVPSLMIFGTGGLAYGTVKTTVSGSAQLAGSYFYDHSPLDCYRASDCPFNVSGSYSGSDKQTKVGWVLGAGVETALTGNWTWKAEYLYMDLGTASGDIPIGGSLSGYSVLNYYSGSVTSPISKSFLNSVG